MTDFALAISGLLALGIAAQWLGWFFKKPAIIFLLTIGIVLGPVLHLFDPDAVLGDSLFPLISLGVAIILFEGALTLQLKEIKNHGRVVTNLVSVGVAITIAIISITTHWIIDLSLPLSLLFGALVCVTGPTVITPLLRSVQPNRNIANILRWEGIIIDPIGALIVVLIYEWIIAGNSLFVFAKTLVIGFLVGGISAQLLAITLRRRWIPEYLNNGVTLSFVLLVFSLSNALEDESGLLTVTIMGMVLANSRQFPIDEILDFKESLSLIIISLLFITLSARIDFAGFAQLGISGIAILLIVMLVARPIAVWISSFRSSLTVNEKLMISWIAPRGIVAAAISSLFVRKLSNAGIEGVDILVPLVFTIIIGTVLIQSLTASFMAQRLNVAERVPRGVLIDGGNALGISVGCALKNNGFDVILASTNYDQIRRARMKGLSTYYGNIVSEHADRHLNLVGIGHLLAMSIRNEKNMLTTLRYRNEFGDAHVYRIKIDEDHDASMRMRTHEKWQTAWLFNGTTTYGKLNALIAENATIKTTTLRENYTYQHYLSSNEDGILLFAIDLQQNLHIFSSARTITPGIGWKIITLTPKLPKKHLADINYRSIKDDS